MAGGAELVNKLNSLEIENKNLKKGKWSYICGIAMVSIINQTIGNLNKMAAILFRFPVVFD